MTWRDRVIQFMREDRADILQRLDLFAEGRCQMHEMQDGKMVDVTEETVTRLRINLAEIEHIMADAGVSLDA